METILDMNYTLVKYGQTDGGKKTLVSSSKNLFPFLLLALTGALIVTVVYYNIE